MPGERGTSEGRYFIELDGVVAVRSTDVSGFDKKHTPFKLYESNKPNPHIGRGNFEVDEVTVKHAHSLNGTGDEVFQWLDGVCSGANVERRTMRLLVFDEDGESVIAQYELESCLPTGFGPEGHKAGGSDASYFHFKVQPEDMSLL